MSYITAVEYNDLTGKDASQATTNRLYLASKLLDSRIGNYPIFEDGWKINSDWKVDVDGINMSLHQSKVDAVKLWVANMISYLYDNNDKPPGTATGVKLGRFSVSGTSSNSSNIPDELSYIDSVLISSGIINRKVGRFRRNEFDELY